MYQGNNVRAIQSQRWLAEALCELMQETSYEKITIGDICARADLSRQTFYNLFDSKEEILRFSLRDAYEERFRVLADQMSISTMDIVNSFACVVGSKQVLLDAMIRNNLSGVIAEEIRICVGLFAGRLVPENRKGRMFPYKEALLSGALSGVLTYWFTRDEMITREELAGLLSDFLSGTFYSLP